MLLLEYFFIGFLMIEFLIIWVEKVCLEMIDFIYDYLGEIVNKNVIFLVGNVYEFDFNFFELYF